MISTIYQKVTRTITYVTEDKNDNNRQEADIVSQKQIV